MSGFTSFVDYDVEKPIVVATNGFETNATTHLTDATTSDAGGQSQIGLFPNEIESSVCENVSFSMQFGESEQGRIICTKVRLRFTPVVIKQKELPLRSKLFDDFYDVPLCSIAEIFISMVKHNSKGKTDKFHRMEQNISSMEVISMIRLVLKDFRVVTIDLHQSQNGTHMANQILFFSKSGAIEKMTQVGAALPEKGKSWKVNFNSYESWASEMKRCGLSTESDSPWRICALRKEGYSHASQGYPSYVVVPSFLSPKNVNRFLQHWKMGRIPIWTWSRQNGNSALLIASEVEKNIFQTEIMEMFIDSVSRCHNDGERPFLVHLDYDFTHHVGKAYDHLVKLCAIDSYDQFVEREISFNQRVHKTGWLHLIRTCMVKTQEVIRWIVDRDRTVVLCEGDSRDMSIVIASLVQICCDSYYRTTSGFQQLVEKMWIALGHPFGERIIRRGVLDPISPKRPTITSMKSASVESTHIEPVWLVFLDCCAQLLRIYPLEFSFSHHLLIALWDVSLSGVVPAFSCNNIEEQILSQVGGGPFPLEVYFEKEYVRMFGNVWHDALIFVEAAREKLPISGTSTMLQTNYLRPPTSFCDIQLWYDCYQRWILPANLKNAGKLLEWKCLDVKMKRIAEKVGNCEWNSQFQLPEMFSSAYPYSIPDITQRITESSLSLRDDKNEFMELRRPSDLDNCSLNSSVMSMSFTHTPDGGCRNSSRFSFINTPTETEPCVKMSTKKNTVLFTNSRDDSNEMTTPTNTSETPILGQMMNRTSTGKPLVPPRPNTLNKRLSSNDEAEQMVTRF